jgi:hypothetical protein
VSWDGGQSFDNPRLLTIPPDDGSARWHIDYPTAAAETAQVLATGFFWALWRQRPVDGSGNVGPGSWKMRRVHVDTSSCCAKPDYQLDLGPIAGWPKDVPIPSDAGPARIGAFIVQGGEIHVVVVYPTYDDGDDVCPGSDTVSVTWMMTTASDADDFKNWTGPSPSRRIPGGASAWALAASPEAHRGTSIRSALSWRSIR